MKLGPPSRASFMMPLTWHKISFAERTQVTSQNVMKVRTLGLDGPQQKFAWHYFLVSGFPEQVGFSQVRKRIKIMTGYMCLLMMFSQLPGQALCPCRDVGISGGFTTGSSPIILTCGDSRVPPRCFTQYYPWYDNTNARLQG